MTKPLSIDRVRDHLEAGNTGSLTELSQQLGMLRRTLYTACTRLVEMGEASATYRTHAKGAELVYRAGSGCDAGIVTRAIAAQPDLASAWHAVARVSVEARAV